MNKQNTLTVSALLGVCVILSGCATTGDFNALKARVDALEANVSAAQSDAAAARAAANDAVNIANQAMDKAAEANARSLDTETKIDRMFKRAMHK
ncbi:Lpp/OprI family alanine-zipper lipoprotein [Nitrosomonas halophila]|uniref:Murein lipoprotein n=1 Tax=Nitrosomonas halophila TaxID=44576 RepID=A0A1H3GRX6_9PROT|nr:Lpp/OprI family alanine-zipper lipoprotein [Nitrosomonas halophila]SDY05224.1 murein lipoprotein [Nitrosomonas halophila]HRQ04460.1 Lpp/OprI family alanine-zipper lipoprotein [Nitrosomonas halophila]